MKMMVKLIVLCATLLLLSGIAFAFIEDCKCYELTATIMDVGHCGSGTDFTKICLNYESNSGTLTFPSGTIVDLYLFFDALNKKMLGANPIGITAYLKFHGDNHYMINGIWSLNIPCRFTIRGHMTDWSNCNCTDGIKDDSETDVDCGGSICYSCVNGKSCNSNSDCRSGNCASGTCQPPV